MERRQRCLIIVCSHMIVFLTLLGSVKSQEIKAKAEATSDSQVGFVMTLFEEGRGVPLLHLNFRTTVEDQKRREIYVWSDGKIHWRDFSKIGRGVPYHYFEATVPKEKVSELLKKVMKSRSGSLQSKTSEPGTKHALATRSIPLVYSLSASFVVLSPEYYDEDAWAMPLAFQVVRNAEIFKQKNQEQILEHLASPSMGFQTEGKNGFLRIVLYNYFRADSKNIGRRIEPADTDDFSIEEKEKYVGRFIADARHFLYCKDLIESLIESEIAQDNARESAPLGAIAHELILVLEKKDDEKVRYEYILGSFEDLIDRPGNPWRLW